MKKLLAVIVAVLAAVGAAAVAIFALGKCRKNNEYDDDDETLFFEDDYESDDDDDDDTDNLPIENFDDADSDEAERTVEIEKTIVENVADSETEE